MMFYCENPYNSQLPDDTNSTGPSMSATGRFQIKNKILISIFCLFMNAESHAGTPVDLNSMLPNHLGKILVQKNTDFNRDGYLDVVVVSESNTEKGEYGYQRILSVFLNHKNKRLDEIVHNKNIIACSKCSSFEFQPDPFDIRGITVSGNKISIVQYFDNKFYPSVADYQFVYQHQTKTFKTVLAKHVLYEVKENGGYKKHNSNHIGEFGEYLDSFNPEWPKLIGIQDKFYH